MAGALNRQPYPQCSTSILRKQLIVNVLKLGIFDRSFNAIVPQNRVEHGIALCRWQLLAGLRCRGRGRL
jgi:hypothetical protein